MATEWIEKLADEIKQKNHDAAEAYGRAQHYAGIVTTRGKEFFIALAQYLQEDVEALRSQLQGDPTASETRVQTSRADEVRIVRSRFPWVDARLTHHEDTITLDYAKGLGVEGDPKMGRVTRAFTFQVAPDEGLFVRDAFAEPAHEYKRPEELAQCIVEMLFGFGG
jgi:hypothetical protein